MIYTNFPTQLVFSRSGRSDACSSLMILIRLYKSKQVELNITKNGLVGVADARCGFVLRELFFSLDNVYSSQLKWQLYVTSKTNFVTIILNIWLLSYPIRISRDLIKNVYTFTFKVNYLSFAT